MSEFYEDENLLLDESLTPNKMLWWLYGILCVAGLVGALSAVDGGRDDVLIALGVAAAFAVIFAVIFILENLLIFRRMRLKMNAERIWSHIPLTKDRSLNWADIRTAAVVQLKGMTYPPMIVLSVQMPAEALTRKRMLWKNPKRGVEMRIPLSDSRRAVIEQQLGMALPDILL